MQVIDVEIERKNNEERIENKNIVIYLNLENELYITQGEETNRLEGNDIMLVPSNSSIVLKGNDSLFVRFEIDRSIMNSIFPQKKFRFFCNSTMDKSDNYALLRQLLTKYIQYYFENHPYRNAMLAKQEYEILIFLVSNFSIGEILSENNNKVDELVDYIEQNYRSDLPLKQISSDFFMTPQYFSKYFKNTMGTTFYKYLSSVRLEHAMKSLLNTDMNLLHVALDHGFPNAESFYRYFQEVYGTTPLEYRKKHQIKLKEKEKKQKEAVIDILDYIDKNHEEKVDLEEVLTIDCDKREKTNRFWAKHVNIDNFQVLQDVNVRDQLKELQASMHYEYARIPLVQDDFEKEDIIDYLRELGLHMWFVIEYRSIKDIDDFCAKFKQMLSYESNRYSVDTVRMWTFELSYNTVFNKEKVDEYWTVYKRIQEILEYFGCQNLMGAGLSLSNMNSIEEFYKDSRGHNVDYTRQTFQSEPYSFVEEAGNLSVARTTDSSYLRNRIISLQQNHIDFVKEENRPYITSWTDNLLTYSVLNDSCFRGAEIIKNVIDCIGYVQAIAPKTSLDLVCRAPSRGKVLFGADGLISKHGIKKPSFYGYAFLNHNGDDYLGKGKHSVVFSHKWNYQIIAHNCKRLSYRYYLDEQNLDIHKYNEYFDDLEPIHLTYNIKGAQDGEYIVKIRMVSTESGSVQDELTRIMGDNDYVHPNEILYLQQVCIPRLRIEKLVVKNGCAKLEVDLPANAFAHIHIIYQF